MCNCINMCRIPDIETSGGKYPSPHHHPKCEDYILQRYIRVSDDDGSSYIDTIESVNEMIKYCHSVTGIKFKNSGLELTDIQLTKDQFESLSEFQGF